MPRSTRRPADDVGGAGVELAHHLALAQCCGGAAAEHGPTAAAARARRSARPGRASPRCCSRITATTTNDDDRAGAAAHDVDRRCRCGRGRTVPIATTSPVDTCAGRVRAEPDGLPGDDLDGPVGGGQPVGDREPVPHDAGDAWTSPTPSRTPAHVPAPAGVLGRDAVVDGLADDRGHHRLGDHPDRCRTRRRPRSSTSAPSRPTTGSGRVTATSGMPGSARGRVRMTRLRYGSARGPGQWITPARRTARA